MKSKTWLFSAVFDFSFYWTVQGYANEAALESYREINTAKVWAGVVFDTSSNDYSTTIPNQVHYKLRVTRLNPQDSWQTANTFPFFRTPGARDDTNEGGTPSECFKLRGTNYSVLSVMRNKKLDLSLKSALLLKLWVVDSKLDMVESPD